MDGLDADIERAFEYLEAAKLTGQRILILGNGGSLAIAQHMAQDL
jgi:phosphoheptose isomerase